MREPSSTTIATTRHVVAVRVPVHGDELLVPLRDLQNLFIRFLRKRPPAGPYSILIMRQDGVPEVHCMFAEGTDARRLSAELRGVPSVAKTMEASRHIVELDEDGLDQVAQVAGPPSFKRAKVDLSEAAGSLRSAGATRRR
jgi:hypothetical protein